MRDSGGSRPHTPLLPGLLSTSYWGQAGGWLLLLWRQRAEGELGRAEHSWALLLLGLLSCCWAR